ncbi:uncharacterized protein LOC122297028 [Carya illinoinensis]|uniref:uncharacterized protein LOC122297028 n=1 Tax=Carya illinoinensis TaxID=32201 RepID=UPI001C729817|nr:uncharacterized protein LOC122297028 [Carya illinoinensis]
MAAYSDHIPIWLNTNGGLIRKRGKRLFRFEAMWVGNKDCSSIVERIWGEGENSAQNNHLMENISKCGDDLSQWNKRSFGNVQKELASAKDKLKGIEEMDPNFQHTSLHKEAREEVQKWLERDELMWKQRSRVQWLKEGDRNSRFFHHKANARRKKNGFHQLQDECGNWKRGDQMGVLVVDFFKNLFSSDSQPEFPECFSEVGVRVSPQMNEELLLPYVVEEVEVAIQQMHPSTAPGPDGMSPVFYQKYWSKVGKSVTVFVLNALNNGVFPKELNHTFISLIPKKNNPSKVSDFRPISLCNVLYKIISKVIANRLKKILPMIIFDTQCAFVPGRQITDNVLVAYETLHYIRSKRVGRKGYMSLKLDMSKAYDRVEWGFLRGMMKTLGFAHQWIELVMFCVSTVSFSILVNSSPKGPVYPSRGIRQGDPLSPYLFLLCTEGLISLLKRNANEGMVEGVRICRGAPRVNHLLFADDSVIFCQADVSTNANILSLLELYERASGQCINKEKTSMVFSKNVDEVVRANIMAMWGGSNTQHFEKYLGLPPMVGRSKQRAFADIKQKLWQKIQMWKGNLLSQGGKEILLKAVAMSIPTYAMSCFLLPKTLCHEMEMMMARFWWGNQAQERKIHWVGWQKLSASKFRGGLGFKNLHDFNMSLLAKQGWRLLTNFDSLLYKIFKARYFPKSSLFEAKIGFNSSYVWKGIHSALPLLKAGCIRRVGNGVETKVFKDNWIPGIQPSVLLGETIGHPQENLQVQDLMDSSLGWWNVDALRALFNPRTVSQILRINVSSNHEDSWYWLDEKSGSFSVRSGYRNIQKSYALIEGEGSWVQILAPFWKGMWNLKIPLKMKMFVWKGFLEILPTYQNLVRKKILESDVCLFCNQCREDAAHALFYCSSINSLCIQFQPLLGAIGCGKSFGEIVLEVKERGNEEGVLKFIAMAWGLWYRRNKFIYDNSFLQFSSVVSTALSMQSDFKKAQLLESSSRDTPRVLIWKPPPQGSLKMNVDGATFGEIDKAGIGLVLRDHEGNVLMTCSKIEHAVANSEFIEATAVLRGLQFGLQWGINKLVMESDCLFLINVLNSSSECLSDFAYVIDEIRRIRSYFHEISFVHVCRQGNNVAHGLARFARNVDDVSVWRDGCPSCVSQAAWLDRQVFVRT